MSVSWFYSVWRWWESQKLPQQWRLKSPRLSQPVLWPVCESVCGLSYAGVSVWKLYCISESLKSYASPKPTLKWFCDTRKVARCSLLLTNCVHKIQVTVTRRWSGFRYCRHKKSSARLNFDLQYSIISLLMLLWNSLLDHQRRLKIPAGDITQVTWLRLANYRLPNCIKFRPFCLCL